MRFTPVCVLAAALAFAAPASAQQQVTTDTSETQAPVCTGTTESAPPASCTPGDAADGAPSATDGQTVGGGQVITDPADEVDGDTASDPAEPAKRGELHVLGNRAIASSSSDTQAAPAQAPAAPTAPAPVPEADAPPRTTAAARTLPFTGVNAGYLALAGSTLLLAGLALRRRAF